MRERANAFPRARPGAVVASLVDASRAMASRAAVDAVVARAARALERCELATPIHFDACARAVLADGDRWVVADDVDASRAHPLVVPLARADDDDRRADRPRRARRRRGRRRDIRRVARVVLRAREGGEARDRGRGDAVRRRGRARARDRSRRRRRRCCDARSPRTKRRHGVGGGAVTAACGVDALDAYAPGELTNSPYARRVEAFLTRRVARFVDADEALIERHLERGDETSALVTAEWCADGPYGGWSRPHAVNAATLARCGRATEARDQARVALSVAPWWTMGEDGTMMAEMQRLSGYAGRSAADVRRTLEGGDAVGGDASGGEPAPTKEEMALKRAMDAMDAVAWGRDGEDWASVRERVAEALDEAGLRALSAHVLAPLRE